MSGFSHSLHGLNDTRFVIDKHQRRDRRALFERALESQCIGASHFAGCGQHRGKSLRFQAAQRFMDRRMFKGACDQARVLARVSHGPRQPAQREIVGFRAAGCEDDFFGRTLKDFRTDAAGAFEFHARGLALTMQACRVAELLPWTWLKKRAHDREGLRTQWCGGVPVEINRVVRCRLCSCLQRAYYAFAVHAAQDTARDAACQSPFNAALQVSLVSVLCFFKNHDDLPLTPLVP